MSLTPSSSKATPLDRASCTIGMAEVQPCNVTDDSLGPDCYESMHAFKKIRTSTSGLRKSPNKWTKEENQKLTALVASYGEKKWKRISAEMGGQKTGAQCAQHWKRVLSPEIRKGHWDENEEDLLLRLVSQYGSCWKKIAKKIPQRTDIQCRYQYLKAKQSREVLWDGKEDESLMKKVMEMTNCNFFKLIGETNESPASSNNDAHSVAKRICNRNKENEADNIESGVCGNRGSIKAEDGSWNDKDDVAMVDSSSLSLGAARDGVRAAAGTGAGAGDSASSARSRDEGSCGNCRTPASDQVSKVVWLEISEHMARLKLTSTLRTALECKTRFMELLGNKISFSAPTNFCPNSSPDVKSDGNKHTNIRSGAIDIASITNSECRSVNDSSFSFKINNSSNANSASNMSGTNSSSSNSNISNSVSCSSVNSNPANISSNNTNPLDANNSNANSSKPNSINCDTVNSNDRNLDASNTNNNTNANTESKMNTKPKPSANSSNKNDTENDIHTKHTNYNNPGYSNPNYGPDYNSNYYSFNYINNSNPANPANKNNTSSISTITTSAAATIFNNNNINISNCSNNNITINITNSYTTANLGQNNINFQRTISHCANPTSPMKTEHMLNPILDESHPLPKISVPPILSPAPPFPAFPHLSLPPFPHLFQPASMSVSMTAPMAASMAASKPVRSAPSGLESLAAVASILPREMLADYAQL